MKLIVDKDAATLTRRGTIVCVRTDKHVWMVNAPDAADIADELDGGKVSSKDMEARGFLAMK